MLNLNSANEDFFFVPRARNSPIKQSFSKIEGLPDKLKIFRISGSKYWQVRFFNHGKYISKSLKTTDKQEAEFFAKDFYTSLKNMGLVDVENPQESTHLRVGQIDNQNLLHDVIQEVLVSATEIGIYPNPSDGIFQVSSLSIEPVQISILDQQGKQVTVFELDELSSDHSFDLSDQAPGVYFAHVSQGAQHWVKKLVLR